MMSKHTPAPWEIDIDTRPAEICTIYHLPTHPTEDGKGQEWAHIRGPIGYWDADEEENMANARLICAAPYLFEALQRIAMNGSVSQIISRADRDFMDAAIAKARVE